jgi:hypothetical protein
MQSFLPLPLSFFCRVSGLSRGGSCGGGDLGGSSNLTCLSGSSNLICLRTGGGASSGGSLFLTGLAVGYSMFFNFLYSLSSIKYIFSYGFAITNPAPHTYCFAVPKLHVYPPTF